LEEEEYVSGTDREVCSQAERQTGDAGTEGSFGAEAVKE